jgi:hypothetical protein
MLDFGSNVGSPRVAEIVCQSRSKWPGTTPQASRSLSMDTRSLQIERLKQAERHISVGREHIARQREMVSELGQEGLDASSAKKLLECLLEIQAAHEDNRRTILDEIVR